MCVSGGYTGRVHDNCYARRSWWRLRLPPQGRCRSSCGQIVLHSSSTLNLRGNPILLRSLVPHGLASLARPCPDNPSGSPRPQSLATRFSRACFGRVCVFVQVALGRCQCVLWLRLCKLPPFTGCPGQFLPIWVLAVCGVMRAAFLARASRVVRATT